MRDRGISRVVVVRVSVFGADNGLMLEAMAELCAAPCNSMGPRARRSSTGCAGWRGRGVRINLHGTSANDIAAATARIDTTAATCAVRSWHVWLFAAPSVIAQL